MTVLFRVSIILLFCVTLSSCCLFESPGEPIQKPPPLVVETEKHVEYSVNHFVTSMMTFSPLAIESKANITYLGFRKMDAFSKKIDSMFEAKLSLEDDLHFSLYQLKSPKSWTLVGKSLKKLKSKYVAIMYLLNPEGEIAWKWKMNVKYTATANTQERILAGLLYTGKEQKGYNKYIVDFLENSVSPKNNYVTSKSHF